MALFKSEVHITTTPDQSLILRGEEVKMQTLHVIINKYFGPCPFCEMKRRGHHNSSPDEMKWSFNREDRERECSSRIKWLKGSEAVQRMKVPSPSQHSAVIGPRDGLQSPLKSHRASLYETVN